MLTLLSEGLIFNSAVNVWPKSASLVHSVCNEPRHLGTEKASTLENNTPKTRTSINKTPPDTEGAGKFGAQRRSTIFSRARLQEWASTGLVAHFAGRFVTQFSCKLGIGSP